MFSDEDKQLAKIRFLLDQWDAIFDGSPASDPYISVSSSFSSSPPGRMPDEASHQTIKELERCLRLLASACPGDYRHLKTFRCGAEWRIVNTWRRMKLPSGKYDWVPHRKSERIVPRWLSPARVLAGEQFICRVFRGEIFLPDDLYKAFTGQQEVVAGAG